MRGTVEVSLNGKPVEKLALTPENNDLLHQFVFKGVDAEAAQYGGDALRGQGRPGVPGGGPVLRALGREAGERAALDRRGLRSHAPGAGRYRHGHRDGEEQSAQGPRTW